MPSPDVADAAIASNNSLAFNQTVSFFPDIARVDSSSPPLSAPLLALAALGLSLGGLACWGISPERPFGAVLLGAAVAVLLAWNWRLRRQIAAALARIRSGQPESASEATLTLETGINWIEERLNTIEHRLAGAHPVSGLPLREALLAQLGADRIGWLGLVAFADLDRLTAFDPALGERAFAAWVARLRRMVPDTRFVAQVDRGHIALWFEPPVAEAAARAELDAIAYALGETITIDGRDIVPQAQIRLAHFDAAQELAPAEFLARTLASFLLPSRDGPLPNGAARDEVEAARSRYELEQDLRHAVSRRELRLHYQPLIDATRGRVSGAEALMRWHHPERGAVPPVRFVPVMEAMGLANEIGLWALNTAVREAAEWRAHGLSDLRMAVNVSGLQLEREDLPLLVQRTLDRHELSPAALEIELTESVATSDAEHCRRIFERLRAMGIKLAVDDFGTGYSSFSALRALAFDKIKLDREFVSCVDSRPDSQAICHSILALGRGLGIRVLAEGVERRAEYCWLRQHGCQHFQGYYFARPMQSDEFVAFAQKTERLAELLSLDTEPELSCGV